MNWGTAEFQSLFLEPSRNGVYKPKEFHGSGAKIINMGELFAYDRVGGQPMARLNMTDHELLKSGVQSGDLLFGRRSPVRRRLPYHHPETDEPTTARELPASCSALWRASFAQLLGHTRFNQSQLRLHAV